MKKVLSIALVILMAASVLSVFPAANYQAGIQEYVQSDWVYVTHTSYDQVSGIACGGKYENVDTPTVASGTKSVFYYGWIGTLKEIKGFSYTKNLGTKVSDDAFKQDPGEAVRNAAIGTGAAYASRFKVTVPTDEGSQRFKIYVEYTDGTSELIWNSVLTVGEATDVDADPDERVYQYLYQNGGGQEPRWWINPLNSKDFFIKVTFTAEQWFDGMDVFLYAASATLDVKLRDNAGFVADTATLNVNGDKSYNVSFEHTHAPGRYTVEFLSDKAVNNTTAHVVLAGGVSNGSDTQVSHNGNMRGSNPRPVHSFKGARGHNSRL